MTEEEIEQMKAELDLLTKKLMESEDQGINRAKVKMSTLAVEEDNREPIDVFLGEVATFAEKYGWDFSALEEDYWDFKLTRGKTALMLKMDFDVQEFYRGQVITEMDNSISLFQAMTQLGKPQ